MFSKHVVLSAAALLAVTACEPSYLPTIAPKDAAFNLSCVAGCGVEGRDQGLAIDVTFLGQHERQFGVCCEHVPSMLTQLQTIADMWCDGLDVPPVTLGDLVVGTTESELTKLRGATLEQGDGYVAFNCDAWLDQLIDKTKTASCCHRRQGLQHD